MDTRGFVAKFIFVMLGTLVSYQIVIADQLGQTNASSEPVTVTDGSLKFKLGAGPVIIDPSIQATTISENGTLGVGTLFIPCHSIVGLPVAYGVQAAATSFGFYSPPKLTGGETVMQIEDKIVSCQASVAASFLRLSGFSTNPGKAWLSSITCNGVTNPESSASFTYVASTGVASWSWSQLFGFQQKVAQDLSCTIVHK